MAQRDLVVRIIGDEKDLLRSLRSSERATRKFSVSVGSIVKSAFIFEGVQAGIRAVTGAIRAGVDEFAQMEAVAAQTNAVLASTGGVANVTATGVENLADKLSKMSGVDDEAIASSENLLLTFKNVRNELGRGNQIFDRTTLAALDLSKAAGGAFGDLDSSAKMLGKALNDPVRGLTTLSRAGVQFTDGQKKTIKALVENNDLLAAQKIILREVESQVGGSAKAFGETLPGQIAKLREAFRNIFGNIVAVVVQPLNRAIGAFAAFMPQIEAGAKRLGAIVEPALGGIIDAFVSRLPELQRIGASILEPLREHVLPVAREVAEVIRNMWENIVKVFDENRSELAGILENLGEVLQNIWTVARPTIVFLFEKVLPAALAVAIPLLEKTTEVTRLMSDMFVKTVTVIIGAIDKFLGGLSTMAEAVAFLPGVGGAFQGIADKINVAREELRAFSAELDAVNQKTIKIPGLMGPVGTEEPGAPTAPPPKIPKIPRLAPIITNAESAADKATKAFEKLMAALSLKFDVAEARGQFKKALDVLNEIEKAIRARIKAVGRETDLLRDLFQVQQQREDIVKQMGEQARKRLDEAIFEALGLTAEGEKRAPSGQALLKRIGTLREQLKGTIFDTGKTRQQLTTIANVLKANLKTLTREIRLAILGMINDIAGALDGADKNIQITKFEKTGIGSIVAGLGLTAEQVKALRGRLGGVGVSGLATAGTGIGAKIPVPAGAGARGGSNIVVRGDLIVQNPRDTDDIVKQVQRKAGRSAASRRGTRPGVNRGAG